MLKRICIFAKYVFVSMLLLFVTNFSTSEENDLCGLPGSALHTRTVYTLLLSLFGNFIFR